MTKSRLRPNEALRYHRSLRGWSQHKVADEIGASNEMISNWERGKKKTSSFYQEKLCALFGMNAEELGFLLPAVDSSSEAPAQETKNVQVVGSANIADLQLFSPYQDRLSHFSDENIQNAAGKFDHFLQRKYAKFDNSTISIDQTSKRELLKAIIDRSFSKGITYDLLSSNIRTMNFRDEWQYVVNNLVLETKTSLRAMVFDVELTRWWNTIAGQVYMITNMELLKRRVPIKRIFILSSLDTRLKMNALMNAYIHHKIGVEVKICTVTNFQESIPFKPDMFSVHDDLFVSLYYLSLEKPLANLLIEEKYIMEFCCFYDEIFMDDRLCSDIESILTQANYGESFFASITTQLELLRRLEKVGSVTELARKQWG